MWDWGFLAGMLTAGALSAFFIALGVSAWRRDRSVPPNRWGVAGRRLGLDEVGGDRVAYGLVGSVDGFHVSLELRHAGLSARDVRLRLAGAGRWPASLAIGPIPSGGIARPAPDPRPLLRLGVPDFDDAIEVRGPDADVMAVLDRRTRAYLTRLEGSLSARGHGVIRVDGGDITLERSESKTDPAEIREHFKQLVKLARALDRRGRTQVRCLVDGARHDIAPMRERCVRLLVDLHRRNPDALDAFRRASNDESVSVRIAGASGLGAEGAATLAAIVRDTHEAPATRASALAAWIAIEPTPSDAATILIALLSPGVDPIEVELTRALGVVGRAESIEPLLSLWGNANATRSVRRTAREALRGIRARLDPVEAGHLSLAELDQDAGALSEADDASGSVSLGDLAAAAPDGDTQ